jgi:hypothetical protein
LPLEEFTSARNDLARRLAKAGRRELAGEIRKLAKPSVPVWAANQLARREPGEVRALLRSAEELRKAQERALTGKGAQDLRERLAEQRRAVRALARLGRDLLASEGRSVSDAVVERIGKTLDAAALDEGTRFLLRAGRLTEELEPPGFDALAGMAVGAPKKRQGRRGGSPAGVAAARRRLQEAQREHRARAREALDADREVERAETAAAEARRAAHAARERSDEAEQGVAEAEAALQQAQRDAGGS